MGNIELTMKNLNKCFDYAREEHAKYIAVVVEGTGKGKEVIINPALNFDEKQEYYNEAYFEDTLVLKNNHAIRIVGFTQADSFDEIQALLGV